MMDELMGERDDCQAKSAASDGLRSCHRLLILGTIVAWLPMAALVPEAHGQTVDFLLAPLLTAGDAAPALPVPFAHPAEAPSAPEFVAADRPSRAGRADRARPPGPISAAPPSAAPEAAEAPAGVDGEGTVIAGEGGQAEGEADQGRRDSGGMARSTVGWGPTEASPGVWGAMEILGERVAPGEKRELVFFTSESYQALSVKAPVLVIRGKKPGATLCLTAAVHGDELNGVEIVRRVLEQTKAGDLHGTLVGVPIVNMLGFERSSRYLPDRRDLNRYFPGHVRGSSASRIAGAFFDAIVRRCDVLIDLHTGSFHRANLPQIRGDLLNPRVAELAKAFGSGVAVHHRGQLGTLRRAATDAGIPAIIYEGGEPMRFQQQEIARGVAGVRNVLNELGLVERRRGADGGEMWTFYETHWIRVNHGGILVSDVSLGDWVEVDQLLGRISDPMGRGRSKVTSPYKGRVIGIALAPVVIPGVAVYHIGLERPATDDGAEVDEVPTPDFAEPEDERPE